MSIAYLDPGNIESDLQSGAVAVFKVNMESSPLSFLNTHNILLTGILLLCLLDINLGGYVLVLYWL